MRNTSSHKNTTIKNNELTLLSTAALATGAFLLAPNAMGDASEDAKDNEVKMWAAKMLPALQAHLKGAEELNPATEQKDGRDSTQNHPTQPDNTARNERDRDSRTLTPLDQGNSKVDTDN